MMMNDGNTGARVNGGKKAPAPAPAPKRRVVKREIRPATPADVPVELSAAERAAVREVCTDPRDDQQRVIDDVVDRLMRDLARGA